MPVLEQLVVAQRQRPRPDEAHLARGATLTSCGSSSSESRRRTRPTRVTRGSSRILNSAPDASFSSLELGLLVGGVDDHRAELEHPELALADPDPPVDVEHRPARVELDRQRDEQPERQPDDDEQGAARGGRRPASAAQSQPVRIGGLQLEQRHARARHVLALLHEQLGRARARAAPCTPCAVRALDDVEHRDARRSRPRRGSARPGRCCSRTPGMSASEVPSTRQALLAGRRDGAEELVGDSPARRAELALEALAGSRRRRRARPAAARRRRCISSSESDA